MSERKDMELIAQLVPPGSRVLDLGCGTGELLALLRDTRQCSGYGVEIADDNVLACTRRGVNVIQLNLEDGLAMFEDQSFDVVLQLDTMQHLRNTERMLRETARVGRVGIVSFPNFAHWANRLRIASGLLESLPFAPWRFGAADYRRAVAAGAEGPPLAGEPVAVSSTTPDGSQTIGSASEH